MIPASIILRVSLGTGLSDNTPFHPLVNQLRLDTAQTCDCCLRVYIVNIYIYTYITYNPTTYHHYA